MRDLASQLNACAINTATLGFQAPIETTIDEIARSGFGGIAPWRREIEDHDVKAIARRIRNAGLTVSGYCRSTYIPASNPHDFRAHVDDNRRAVHDAAELGAAAFVMVVGGLPPGSKDLRFARAQVADACAELAELGQSLGVRIGLEPLHPVYAAERSCVTLLSEALDLCDAMEGDVTDPWLGIVIDCYHVWWDPYLAQCIARAGQMRRIFGFHVCDWLLPTEDVLNDRGMMGDGVIDVRGIRGMIESAGYHGPVEVEIFSALNWWRRPMSETLAVCRERLATVT